ncbi:hypothetical protein MPTK1_3g14810 [Marchantia polymorpha subsp. ruderalis]
MFRWLMLRFSVTDFSNHPLPLQLHRNLSGILVLHTSHQSIPDFRFSNSVSHATNNITLLIYIQD